MAIVQCKECGNEVSTEADACPKCGARQVKPPQGMGKGSAAFLWIMVLLFLWFYSTWKPGPLASKSAGATPAAAPEPSFEITDFSCSGEHGYSWATGHVKNNSAAKVSAIKVTASFYGPNKSLIDTGWGYALTTPVLPGQTSAFKVYGPHNQKVKSCSVDGAG